MFVLRSYPGRLHGALNLMSSKVYVVTGMPGAGKEEFAQTAVSLGYSLIRMGDVVRKEAANQGIIMDDRGVGGFASDERRKHGADIWARRCLPYIEHNSVIDGCRSLDEMSLFREKFGKDSILIAIEAPADLRFKRLQQRGRSDAPQTIEEFKERDLREIGWGLADLIKCADDTIVNDDSLESFHEKVKKEIDHD